MAYETFRVNAHSRAPLVEFMVDALRASGCAIVNQSPPEEAPFRISFITPSGERMGIIAYAFFANFVTTKNRPKDEWRFQMKYSSKDDRYHTIWQDPFGLYTTLLLGINPDKDGGFFVGADPTLNSPTRFFISKEFKQEHVDAIRATGWHSWERLVHTNRVRLARSAVVREDLFSDNEVATFADGHEILVGGTAEHFLRYVLFERGALGEDQGHRQLLAEQVARGPQGTLGRVREGAPVIAAPPMQRLHELEREFDLSHEKLLSLIAEAPRLKMAVRGWVAEEHLRTTLERIESITDIESIEQDGQPDVRVRIRGGRNPVLIECKNVLRTSDREGRPRLDFMRTRASPADPCSRYYMPSEFQVVAACLHAKTERWDFAAHPTETMSPHQSCLGRLHHRVVIDETWSPDLEAVIRSAAA